MPSPSDIPKWIEQPSLGCTLDFSQEIRTLATLADNLPDDSDAKNSVVNLASHARLAAGSRSALINLPTALAHAEFDLSSFLHQDPRPPNAGEVRQLAEVSLDPFLFKLAAAITGTWANGTTVPTREIGTGRSSWVLSQENPQVVLLLSKGIHAGHFDEYRRRYNVASIFRAAGFDQPRVFGIGRIPVLHAFMEHVAGESFGALAKECVNGGSRFWNAVEALAQTYREIKEIPLKGYGRLTRIGPGEYGGKFESEADRSWGLISPFSCGSGHGDAALETAAKEVAADTDPPILGFPDSNFSNLRWDTQWSKVKFLDTDLATCFTPAALLASLSRSWVDPDPAMHALARDAYNLFCEIFETDPIKRGRLMDLAEKRILLEPAGSYFELRNDV